ncbi:hypothetical protein ACJIZ3_009255 [Penstemon smallii]|uniref:Uncharacterized protein n=1 Tax=Penstemon smallii TaxID=265156 RepID=A0ABD3TBZ3_9LAMI
MPERDITLTNQIWFKNPCPRDILFRSASFCTKTVALFFMSVDCISFISEVSSLVICSSSVSVPEESSGNRNRFFGGIIDTIPAPVESSRIGTMDFLTNKHPNPVGFSPKTL